MNTLAIVTSTRAEYGLLAPIIKKFRAKENSDFHLDLIVTGTHLSPNYGYTMQEIEKDDIRIDIVIEIPIHTNDCIDISMNMAETLNEFAHLFEQKKYTSLMILGDRYEMLMIAIAAMNSHIPIFHLCGGDTTEGAIDECIRHSITKMSHFHFVTNEFSRNRVIQLGENPNRVFNVGSTSVDNILNLPLLSKEDILNTLNLPYCNYALCTYHPITLEKMSIQKQVSYFIDSIRQNPKICFIVTKANADEGGEYVNKLLDEYSRHIANLYVFDSLGVLRYLSLMKSAEFVMGNSSSGIIETPIFKIPTINIGDRQKGRYQCGNVINAALSLEEIRKAITIVQTKEFKKICNQINSPYGKGDAATKIVEITLLEIKKVINLKKKFFDIECETIA